MVKRKSRPQTEALVSGSESCGGYECVGRGFNSLLRHTCERRLVTVNAFDSHQNMVLYRLWSLNWSMVILIVAIGLIGVGLLFYASHGSWQPWALTHAVRLGVGVVVMLTIAVMPSHWLYHLAWPGYVLMLVLLVLVAVFGVSSSGATRWLTIGPLVVQPSEFAKVAIIIALARYAQDYPFTGNSRWLHLGPALLLMALPVAIIFLQPDLGTAVLVLLIMLVMLFMAGAPIMFFASILGLTIVALPALWLNLHTYQKARILTFIDPESDPLGRGYHIIQSKIAMGSGGFWGRGPLKGTQSQLEFLPEKHTDFIFAFLAEEWGLAGSILLIALIVAITLVGWYALRSTTMRFHQCIGVGALSMFVMHSFINIAMVSGLIPVVGLPLPLVSYGGSALMAQMMAFGLCLNVSRAAVRHTSFLPSRRTTMYHDFP